MTTFTASIERDEKVRRLRIEANSGKGFGNTSGWRTSPKAVEPDVSLKGNAMVASSENHDRNHFLAHRD